MNNTKIVIITGEKKKMIFKNPTVLNQRIGAGVCVCDGICVNQKNRVGGDGITNPPRLGPLFRCDVG